MRDRVAAGERLLLGKNPIGLTYSGQLLRGTGAADERWIKAGEVLSHALGVVSFGIHGDIDDLNLIRRHAQFLPRLGQDRKRRRTDFGTRSEAETQYDHLAAIAAEPQFATVGSAQGKIGC